MRDEDVEADIEAEVDDEMEAVVIQCETCGEDRMELDGLGNCDICAERQKRTVRKLAERGLS